MPFLDSLDIANRTAQICGAEPIMSSTEDSKTNRDISFAYDKVRRAELRRNTWRCAIREVALRAVDTDTMTLVPSTYSASKTYLPGAIVADSNGLLWQSMTPENVNNTPGDTDVWDMYFGPLTVTPYSSATTYYAGELVYVASGIAGQYVVYQSLISANADNPATATAWASTTTYDRDAVVSYSGSQWRSLVELNINCTPADGPLAFDVTATYSSAQTVTGSDNYIYSSVAGGNVGHDPTTDGGVHWTNTNVVNGWSRTPTVPTSGINWRVVDCTLANLAFSYPIGSGPYSQSGTSNVFRLPAGYLRLAPQDPKGGQAGPLGGPSGNSFRDWLFQSNFIVSGETGPIIFRFVADITKVSSFDDMFCEGLAYRIATAVCESITQSSDKLGTIASAYKLFMSEARTSNAIEQGAEYPPEDEYITVRA